MTSLIRKYSAALLACFGLVWGLLGCRLRLDVASDGAYLLDALRWLGGEWPYRDFVAGGTPAHGAVLAAWVKLFGPSLLVERVWNAVLISAVPPLIYLAVRRWLTERWAVVSALGALALLTARPYLIGPLPSALLLCWAAMTLALSAEVDRGPKRLLAIGALFGAAFWFRQDVAAQGFLAVALFYYLRRRERFEKLGRDLLSLLIGTASTLALGALLFLSRAPVERWLYELCQYPLFIRPAFTRLPYPVGLIPLALPAFVAGMWILLMARGRHSLHSTESNFLLLLTLAGALSFYSALRRPVSENFLPMALYAVPLAAWSVRAALRHCAGRVRTMLGIGAVAVMAALLLGSAARRADEWMRSHRDPFRLRVEGAGSVLPMPRGTEATQRLNHYGYAINYIRHFTGPNQPIFVGSVRHDRVCSEDPLFYVLADRPPATRYHRLPRGELTHPDVQRRIIRELEGRRVSMLVLRKDLDDLCTEPNLSSKGRGADLLDEYLKSRYAVKTKFGGNWILERVW